ncbi:uncharacterized protein Z520_07840 [Fonsecaea multimorphosa CBS 102226]|uniref:Uncharacterized protein n=1 Tax=Fonsecaea multimorphosa CBS 102226 TaxID=1442371 RepID=A0A0D2K0R8_9EURO|nr:uncharacterized protein Z520_07840 [Fonsecaea multimorphosa CBS 102226]KIX96574.1 hypothetical protein Z520_07840 [Fonsecaea multimorphosa CBS 102226]OAL22086.1 hypothetical protein AYO22_07446 [Fonsecaea multimorphosa]
MVPWPFQKLCCVQPADGQQPFLLAASGPVINSLSLKDGSLLNRWPPSDPEDEEYDEASTNGQETRPPKRRKLGEGTRGELAHQESEDSIEIISERKKGERRKPKVENTTLPNVSHIITTSDGKTAICVTGEDKSVLVFDVLTGGVLNLKSQRSMPKRICAIVLTPDEKSLLLGDKFGDVYLLPLNPTAGWTPQKLAQDQQQATFSPSASELTVHTKGNLEALKQQRQQKAAQPKKEGPQFECKLLLGHVSLLTDVAITEVQSGLRRREYILTADRDEHIRVSRGVSQAHIIENYCFGHREFVSKLCVVPWNPEILVTGSGEPSVKVYHWQTGELLDQELFQGDAGKDIVNCLDLERGGRSLDSLAVSNIWPVHYTVSGNSPRSRQPPHLLLVALEGLPMLLSYSITQEGRLRHHQTLTLGGNVLDVTIGPALWEIVVSIDTIHRPGSIRVLRPEETPAGDAFETFELFSNIPTNEGSPRNQPEGAFEADLRWERSSLAMLLNTSALDCGRGTLPSEGHAKDKGAYSAAGELLYGLENLRKKRGQAGAEAEEEEGREGIPADAEGMS